MTKLKSLLQNQTRLKNKIWPEGEGEEDIRGSDSTLQEPKSLADYAAPRGMKIFQYVITTKNSSSSNTHPLPNKYKHFLTKKLPLSDDKQI